MTNKIHKVYDSYGHVFYISEDDLFAGRIQLPLYTKTGRKFTDTAKGMKALREGSAVSVHVSNVKFSKRQMAVE